MTRELASVRRLGMLAGYLADPGTIDAVLADELMTVAGADEVHVHHLDDHAPDELVVVYLLEGGARLSYFVPRLQRPPGIESVIVSGRPFIAANAQELATAVPQLAGTEEAHCALLLPFGAGDTRGREAVVSLVRGGARPRFGPADVELAGVLVDQAAMIRALVRARIEAGVDPVSGCMNHRGMRQRLDEEINRAARLASLLSCLLIDLDDFKAVNDRHGHQAGDEFLRLVAQTLMNEVRAFDRVARYGGDEFVVILPNADLDNATAAARRALSRLAQVTLSVADLPTVSASIGVAQWQPPMTADELLSACDSALLASKRAGKDTVTAAPLRQPPG